MDHGPAIKHIISTDYVAWSKVLRYTDRQDIPRVWRGKGPTLLYTRLILYCSFSQQSFSFSCTFTLLSHPLQIKLGDWSLQEKNHLTLQVGVTEIHGLQPQPPFQRHQHFKTLLCQIFKPLTHPFLSHFKHTQFKAIKLGCCCCFFGFFNLQFHSPGKLPVSTSLLPFPLQN